MLSSRDMRENLVVYNEQRIKDGLETIDNGIGIHTGLVMMATVGNDNRLSTTVYSDAVNTAARLESLTKEVGASILISEEVIEALEEEDRADLPAICLGTTKVKGKDKPVRIYQYFAHESPALLQLKMQHANQFENIAELLDSDDHKQAQYHLALLEQLFPNDSILLAFRRKMKVG